MSDRLLELCDVDVDLLVDGQHRRVIHKLSLEIGRGEAVALVGESGSGKSMTTRAITRTLPANAQVTGEIRFDGMSVAAMNRAALRAYRTNDVGLILQDPRAAINPVRRVEDFLNESLVSNAGVRRRDARARTRDLLLEVGITNPDRCIRQYPHELSGGMLQRVMIASVIAMKPRLLIADEPTTALDVTTQAEVMAILDELRERLGMALLLITHDLELAAAICDRTAVMYAGQLVEEQASDVLHVRPLHPYAAGLLASRPGLTAGQHLPVIPGRPRSGFEVGDGCPFTDRCPFVADECRTGEVVLRRGPSGSTACVRADELGSPTWPSAERHEEMERA